MHVKVFSLAELLERLTKRLALLRDGARDLPARQQTMEDAIAWSYELLTEAQQRCFRALSVFVGGWTLEAAEAVCWDEQAIAGRSASATLAALVDASLVQAEMAADGVTRFTMLDMLHEYALERLRAAGEEAVCRSRHAAYYAQVARTSVLFGPGQGTRDAQLMQELPNSRAALQWVEHKRDVELGLQLACFSRLWYMSGQVSEAELWTERMLTLDRQARERAAPTALRVDFLFGLGQILLSRGKLERAAEVAQEALRQTQQVEDHRSLSNTYDLLGQVAFLRGKSEEASTYFTEEEKHARLSGNSESKGRALMHLAESALMQGDYARATTLLEEALACTNSRNAVGNGRCHDHAGACGSTAAELSARQSTLPGKPDALPPASQSRLRRLVPGGPCSHPLCRRALCPGHTPVCGSGDFARTGPDTTTTG